MVRPRSDVPERVVALRPRLLAPPVGQRGVLIGGYDAGVSFRSVHDPATGTTHTVISNSSDGAWPITTLLDELLAS